MMANIIGGYFTSPRSPGIGGRHGARADQETPYWKPFFDGYPPIREWLATGKDPMSRWSSPTITASTSSSTRCPLFAVGAAPTYDNADEGWGLPVYKSFTGHPCAINGT